MCDNEKKIRRVFVEKRAGFDVEARRLKAEIEGFLGVSYPALARLNGLRLLARYDVDRLSDAQFKDVVDKVLSEPQADRVFYGSEFRLEEGDLAFGVEYLPGQYDQRADSAEQCAELAAGVRPVIRAARIIILRGEELGAEAMEAVKSYFINPVDSREASLAMPKSLGQIEIEAPDVPVLAGFRENTAEDSSGRFAAKYGLAMSSGDLDFCRAYFTSLARDPTLAELRVLDTYWSDHCRHTTFTTSLDEIKIEEGPLAQDLRGALALYEDARREVYGENRDERKRSLMDIATLGVKTLGKRGLLSDLDESKEINACSVRIKAEFDGAPEEDWILFFKNETHNHPTEIEPFGGAATCLGGAIRDPLSGRAYVHGAMRVTGGADPSRPLYQTLPGKLPQLKIAREAAAGYSSYGNQIGLATGQVAEFYHEGFLAKRMELGAVIGAAPAAWIRREEPAPGDLVLLVGGRTGRDGIGGATGSSKVHTGESVENAGAEVQKGNAVEERKLQRLFRNPAVTALVKRCNDFGAGGVSVAVGELAAGLDIDLDQVPKKYSGLDGVELAISESQERMALVVDRKDAEKLIQHAAEENLEAVIIARVTADEKLRMNWRGKTIVNLERSFLDSNGAPRGTQAVIGAKDNRLLPSSHGTARNSAARNPAARDSAAPFLEKVKRELGGTAGGSRRGLQERFDGSIGAGSVLFPWGGKTQGTPECGMAALLPALDKSALTATLMTFGYDPDVASQSPYLGALGAVREALAKFACLGGDPFKARLSFQEYFERMEKSSSWGKPLAALLGALEAQLKLGIPALGGKDSMSGTYRDEKTGITFSVPPTLVAFAAGTSRADRVLSGALSGEADNAIILFYPPRGSGFWEPFSANLRALGEIRALAKTLARDPLRAAYPLNPSGPGASLALMAFGNMAGAEIINGAAFPAAGYDCQGAFLAEVDGEVLRSGALDAVLSGCSWTLAGRTLSEAVLRIKPAAAGGQDNAAREAESPEEISLETLRQIYEAPLSKVYPETSVAQTSGLAARTENLPAFRRVSVPPREKSSVQLNGASPLVVIPVFPGTNCEWDMENAFRKAGGRTRQIIFRNRDREDIRASTQDLAAAIREAQIVAIPGGFSAGDEPDGSGKFIANVLRSPLVAGALSGLLDTRDGLVIGICNGFQALVKLGLVPYGGYRDAMSVMPTLAANNIGRHVSRMVRTRVMSKLSPWLALEEEGAVHVIPVSHGEGRLVIDEEEGRALFASGQAAFCYADENGKPAMAEPDNPNGSAFALEGITSPDGRILGKMGHSERSGPNVHINIPGNKHQRIFEAGVRYFR